jgi:hypothetical protein
VGFEGSVYQKGINFASHQLAFVTANKTMSGLVFGDFPPILPPDAEFYTAYDLYHRADACVPYRTQSVRSFKVYDREPEVVPEVVPPPVYKLSSVHAIPSLKESFWEGVCYNVKSAVLKCFGCGDVAADWERERTFKKDVNWEMLTVVEAQENRTVVETVVEQVHAVNKEAVHHVPRLVAQATVALRMKLGLGAMDRSVAGNVAVVRSEAAKLLRDWNVRTLDAAAHLHHIERCFFEDDSHYRVTTWRARATRNSRLLRWFLGTVEQVKFDC